MTTETTIPTTWQRAMARAEADSLQAVETKDGRYAVPSTHTCPGRLHFVELTAGRITHCDCLGWGGRQRPCKHAGAVARLLVSAPSEQAPGSRVRVEPEVFVTTNHTRGQLFPAGR